MRSVKTDQTARMRMLNSAELDIFFLLINMKMPTIVCIYSTQLSMTFFLLINMKVQTIVYIFIFISTEKFIRSAEFSKTEFAIGL